MSAKTSIEWTSTVNADGSVTPGATWNPVRGCTKVSPGCAHCYAETFAERFRGVPGHPYEQGFDLRLVPEKLLEPLRWKTPRRIFVNSMSDLFQDGVPDEFIDHVFAVMALAPRHTFQVLTKRAERMREYLAKTVVDGRPTRMRVGLQGLGICLDEYPTRLGAGIKLQSKEGHVGELTVWPLQNVWLGPSIENQCFADERFPIACDLADRGWKVMVSMEPLLGQVKVPARFLALGRRAWVIVGGESGPDARPFDVAWVRSIVRQCRADGVACFVKQLGAHVLDRNDSGFDGDTPTSWPMDTATSNSQPYQGEPLRVHLKKKGGDPSEWPEDLRVREFPHVTVTA